MPTRWDWGNYTKNFGDGERAPCEDRKKAVRHEAFETTRELYVGRGRLRRTGRADADGNDVCTVILLMPN